MTGTRNALWDQVSRRYRWPNVYDWLAILRHCDQFLPATSATLLLRSNPVTARSHIPDTLCHKLGSEASEESSLLNLLYGGALVDRPTRRACHAVAVAKCRREIPVRRCSRCPKGVCRALPHTACTAVILCAGWTEETSQRMQPLFNARVFRASGCRVLIHRFRSFLFFVDAFFQR